MLRYRREGIHVASRHPRDSAANTIPSLQGVDSRRRRVGPEALWEDRGGEQLTVGLHDESYEGIHLPVFSTYDRSAEGSGGGRD